VVVEVRIKNMKNEDVKVDIQDTSLSVTAKLAVGNTYYNILGTGTGRKLKYGGTTATEYRYESQTRVKVKFTMMFVSLD